jgi:NTE family protein
MLDCFDGEMGSLQILRCNNHRLSSLQITHLLRDVGPFNLSVGAQTMAVSSDRNWIRRWIPSLSGRSAPPTEVAPSAGDTRVINLALQGGGAHGAFTWGVLDTLLQDERIQFDGISGSSAGAINAVLLADGWVKDGRDGARHCLDRFWTAIGQQLPLLLMAQHHNDRVEMSPLGRLMQRWTGTFSPAQLNPFDLNPLRDLLNDLVDFERLRQESQFKLFVSATNVRTGKLRIFRESELSVDVMLASTCLPRIHHPIVMDGETYWDGGFSANPPVAPLFGHCDAQDLLLVLLNPLVRHETPTTMSEIDARITELAFTASFMAEMRVLLQTISSGAARNVAKDASGFARRVHGCRFHMIDTSHLPAFQQSDTKLLAYGPFLTWLRDLGKKQASAWLSGPSSAVGRHSSVDLHALLA